MSLTMNQSRIAEKKLTNGKVGFTGPSADQKNSDKIRLESQGIRPVVNQDGLHAILAKNTQGSESSTFTAPILPLPVPGQKDAHFKSACLLTHLIDTSLESERVHFRTKSGLLLTTLDQVIQAVLDNDLAEAGPG